MESITYVFPLTDAEPNWVYGRRQLVVTVRGAEAEFAPHCRPFANGDRNENHPYVGWTCCLPDVPNLLAEVAGRWSARHGLALELNAAGCPSWVYYGVSGWPGWWREVPGFDSELDGKPWGTGLAKLAAMIDWDAVDHDAAERSEEQLQ